MYARAGPLQCGEGAESACLGLGLTFTVSGFLPIPPTKDLRVSENMLNNILRNTEKSPVLFFLAGQHSSPGEVRLLSVHGRE